jgi:hypothetical protein
VLFVTALMILFCLSFVMMCGTHESGLRRCCMVVTVALCLAAVAVYFGAVR